MSCLFSLCLPKKNKSTGENQANPLSSVTWKDTIPFVPPVTKGKVIKVYDGDTITIATKLPFANESKDTIWRFSVRLDGIDCPEIKGKTETEKNIPINCAEKHRR